MIFRTLFALFFLIAFADISFAQNKVIRPKKGEIVFISETKIINELLFRSNMQQLQQKMINLLKTKLELQGDQEIDTTLVQQFMKSGIMADFMVQPENKQHHHIYENNFIKSFESNDGITPEQFNYINVDSSNYSIMQVMGGDSSITEATAFEYQNNKDVIIKELRKEQKLIKGYKCFKVIYQYKENFDDDEELRKILEINEYSIKEFWVTEEIASLFHPVCRIKEILTKYYPLEISEESPLAKGLKINYKLKNISLSN